MVYRKMTLKQKQKLYQLWKHEKLSYKQLAERYSISGSTVNRLIRQGKEIEEVNKLKYGEKGEEDERT